MPLMLKSILGGAAGAAGGFLLYRFIGCRTGTCPLNSNPWIAMAVWGVVGFLLASGR
ncbi:MAG: hypothetical protein KBC66_08690 [Kiritimatiellae bacterium]|nr:hypothetical protein [Kiritimatiellia bacterium]NLD89854.1 hypothetical protein [Lentisphaerota bacterium]HPC19647.1 hypothetical protein [Kiritimatiellia bacterium]